jgi:hypothetical protein
VHIHFFPDESGCESDMAEGIDESENNSNSGEQASMLRAVMPCETLSPNYGSIKREIESTTLATNDKNSNSILHRSSPSLCMKTVVSDVCLLINFVEFYRKQKKFQIIKFSISYH